MQSASYWMSNIVIFSGIIPYTSISCDFWFAFQISSKKNESFGFVICSTNYSWTWYVQYTVQYLSNLTTAEAKVWEWMRQRTKCTSITEIVFWSEVCKHQCNCNVYTIRTYTNAYARMLHRIHIRRTKKKTQAKKMKIFITKLLGTT